MAFMEKPPAGKVLLDDTVPLTAAVEASQSLQSHTVRGWGGRPGPRAGAGRRPDGGAARQGAGTGAGQVCEPAASLLPGRGRGGVPAHPRPPGVA